LCQINRARGQTVQESKEPTRPSQPTRGQNRNLIPEPISFQLTLILSTNPFLLNFKKTKKEIWLPKTNQSGKKPLLPQSAASLSLSPLQRRSARRAQPAPTEPKRARFASAPGNAQAPECATRRAPDAGKRGGAARLPLIPGWICFGACGRGGRSRGAEPASCVRGRPEAPLRAVGGGNAGGWSGVLRSVSVFGSPCFCLVLRLRFGSRIYVVWRCLGMRGKLEHDFFGIGAVLIIIFCC
jgi:hypothetical protein